MNRGSADARTGQALGAEPTAADFQHLLAFRVRLRQFQHWSEAQARGVGLTHVQHQLLVAVKGHSGARPPAMGEVADARIARVRLTRKGDRLVSELTQAPIAELHHLAAVLNEIVPTELNA